MSEYRNGKGGRRNGGRNNFGERGFERKPYGGSGERRTFGERKAGRPTGDRPYEKKPYGERKGGFEQKPFERNGRPERFASRPVRMPSPRLGGRPAPMPAARPPRPVEPAPHPFYGDAEPENILAGRNPIREAIKAGRAIERLLVARGLTGSALEIIARARQAGIVVQEVERSRLDAIYPNHQGMLAYASAADYLPFEELLEIPAERGEDAFFVVLDGVTDPHNLGAILRTAACAGAHGVIVPERRAVGLVPAAVKAAAGALEHIAVSKVGNLRQALETMKERGIWLTAAASDGEDSAEVDLTGPIALVVGAEGDGVSPLIRSTCDRVVSLPMSNDMESLNASVAAGILLYDIRRARARA